MTRDQMIAFVRLCDHVVAESDRMGPLSGAPEDLVRKLRFHADMGLTIVAACLDEIKRRRANAGGAG